MTSGQGWKNFAGISGRWPLPWGKISVVNDCTHEICLCKTDARPCGRVWAPCFSSNASEARGGRGAVKLSQHSRSSWPTPWNLNSQHSLSLNNQVVTQQKGPPSQTVKVPCVAVMSHPLPAFCPPPRRLSAHIGQTRGACVAGPSFKMSSARIFLMSRMLGVGAGRNYFVLSWMALS